MALWSGLDPISISGKFLADLLRDYLKYFLSFFGSLLREMQLFMCFQRFTAEYYQEISETLVHLNILHFLSARLARLHLPE